MILKTAVGRGVECAQRLGWQGAATRHSQLYGEELQRRQASRWACYTPRSGLTFWVNGYRAICFMPLKQLAVPRSGQLPFLG